MPSNLLHLWIKEFLDHIAARQPAFIALHLQEVGGKTYEKSMEYVQEFIKQLCESDELRDYNRIRVYLDEDYNSAEHFTALGNLYFVQRSVSHVLMWNFLTHEWDSVEGKSIHTGSIETVATKEKAKFPQQFFPECKWSRKGFLRTRWFLNGTVFDLVNIHLFHDASNLEACEEYPSVYCKSRRRALVHTLERFHKDTVNRPVPYFVFGDFNFRCDTEGVIKKLTEDLTMHRVQNTKNDSTKVQYRDATGTNVLTVGKKEFFHCDQSTFKENWLRQFDRELESLRSILYEFPITFPPSYPYEEDPFQPGSYMATRCPAWCDRILVSPAARKLICEDAPHEEKESAQGTNNSAVSYGIIGANVCMGDHKPVFLNIRIKTSQGIVDNCSCDTHVPRKLRVEHPIYDNSASMDSSSNNNTIVVSLSSYGSTAGSPPDAALIRQLVATAAHCSDGGDSSAAAAATTIIPFAPPLDAAERFAYHHQLHYPPACPKCAARIEQCYEQNLIGLEPTSSSSTTTAPSVMGQSGAHKQPVLPALHSEPGQAGATLDLLSQACFRYQHPLVSINVFDTDSNLNVCMCALYCNAGGIDGKGVRNGDDEHGVGGSPAMCPNCRNIIKHQPVEHRKTLVSRRMMLANDVIVNRIDTHYLNTYSLPPGGASNGGQHQPQHAFEPYTPESAESHSPLPESSDSSKASQSTIPNDGDGPVSREGRNSRLGSKSVPAEDEFQPLVPAAAAAGDAAAAAPGRERPGDREVGSKSETDLLSVTTTAGQTNDAKRSAVSHQRAKLADGGSSFGGVSPRQLKSRLEKLKRLADERRKQYGEWTRSFSQSDTSSTAKQAKADLPSGSGGGGGSDGGGPSPLLPTDSAEPAESTLLGSANSYNHSVNSHSEQPAAHGAAATVTSSIAIRRDSVIVNCCRGMCTIL
uniref:inositol-polyphosphate 5-phosphatase n=1 Tax=Anopheles epiroticus TaxID=199890 RepID=A0A182P7J7_9DIPT